MAKMKKLSAMLAKSLEEEIKNKIADEFFKGFDTTKIIGKVDFCVSEKTNKLLAEAKNYLWAEAKRSKTEIDKMLSQLILTIGRARTFDRELPPAYLGAFDSEKIAFVPYHIVSGFFYENDFNWTVTPSDHSTKEFKAIHEKVRETIDTGRYIFRYDQDFDELRQFIKENFTKENAQTTALRIDKNNFISIYSKWREHVKPSLGVDWNEAKKAGIIDGDFYLADLLSSEGKTIRDNLYIVLQQTRYIYGEKGKKNKMGGMDFGEFQFNDNQRAYNDFWRRYDRPPKQEYHDYIIGRRDLLVPQDVRERKGSFFTPQIWVEKSQQYLADYLGENWQDEYYIWDCAAGTGNLLANLTNKYKVFASTLDHSDVSVMHERIANGANMLKEHVFQFDFLNDSFTSDKVPQTLKDIIKDKRKREKLIIYINPPYAEAGNSRTMTGTGEHKAGTAIENDVYLRYRDEMGKASQELFAQFFMRIYKELEGCTLAEFSKLKILQGSNFEKFRGIFRASLEKLFLVPGDTFDNVKGQFPIGFFIWNTKKKADFTHIEADVFDKDGDFLQKKTIHYNNKPLIGKWLSDNKSNLDYIGCLNSGRTDFQHQKLVYIANYLSAKQTHALISNITAENLIVNMVYLAVRHCIKADWLNDRDQFYYPNDGWQDDEEFQSDCLAFTLFHGQNRITAKEGINHWIPFSEKEVDAPTLFKSHFMADYINGKIELPQTADEGDIFADETQHKVKKIIFSPKAAIVMERGKALWRYYMTQEGIDTNASFYDIKEYFQGRDEKGRMNSRSNDDTYTQLLNDLKEAIADLAKQIEPKIYQYGFLLDSKP